MTHHIIQPRSWLRRLYTDATTALTPLQTQYTSHDARRRSSDNDVRLWRHVELARALNASQRAVYVDVELFSRLTLREAGLSLFVPPMLLIANSVTLATAPKLYRSVRCDCVQIVCFLMRLFV